MLTRVRGSQGASSTPKVKGGLIKHWQNQQMNWTTPRPSKKTSTTLEQDLITENQDFLDDDDDDERNAALSSPIQAPGLRQSSRVSIFISLHMFVY